MTKREEYEQKTEELITPITEKYNFELIDVEYVKEGGCYYLRVYIDKQGGITVDDCEIVSREFNDVLDREDYISDFYIFEVSSPGLGRVLKKEKDYIRNIGEEVDIKLYKPMDGQKEFSGILESYENGTFQIRLVDETTIKLTEKEIAQIRLAFDF